MVEQKEVILEMNIHQAQGLMITITDLLMVQKSAQVREEILERDKHLDQEHIMKQSQ